MIPSASTLLTANLVVTCTFCALPVMADWDYTSTETMIKGADVIAVVNIGAVQDTNAPRKSLEFHQKAQATVEQTLKGSPPKSFTIYGGINCKGFVACVPDVSLSSGRSLVFLRRKGPDSDAYVSANADRGIQKIINDSVLWRENSDRAGKQMKLGAVAALVKAK